MCITDTVVVLFRDGVHIRYIYWSICSVYINAYWCFNVCLLLLSMRQYVLLFSRIYIDKYYTRHCLRYQPHASTAYLDVRNIWSSLSERFLLEAHQQSQHSEAGHWVANHCYVCACVCVLYTVNTDVWCSASLWQILTTTSVL